MSPIVLSAWDQLAVGAIWALTLLTAYLRGSEAQRARHIAALEAQLAFLRGLSADEDEAA